MLKCSIEECFKKSAQGCRECTPTEDERKQAADVLFKKVFPYLAPALLEICKEKF